MDVKDLLQSALAVCGGSQRELARRTKINFRSINRWFREGTEPELKSKVLLGQVVGIPAEAIVGSHMSEPRPSARPLGARRKKAHDRKRPAPLERPQIPPPLAKLAWFPMAWVQRMQAAKENGKKIGPTGERQQLERLLKALGDPEYGEAAVRSLVEDATAGGWQGIKLEWYQPRRSSSLPASMERHRAFAGRTAEETDIDARARRAAHGGGDDD